MPCRLAGGTDCGRIRPKRFEGPDAPRRAEVSSLLSSFISVCHPKIDQSAAAVKSLCTARRSMPSNVGLIEVAPSPVLTGFDRFHDGMSGLMKVRRGVTIGRRVATAHVPAREAHAQVNPMSAGAQTFHAALTMARSESQVRDVHAGIGVQDGSSMIAWISRKHGES